MPVSGVARYGPAESSRECPDLRSTRLTQLSPATIDAGGGAEVVGVAGEGFEPPKVNRLIYSQIPLAAWVTCPGRFAPAGDKHTQPPGAGINRDTHRVTGLGWKPLTSEYEV